MTSASPPARLDATAVRSAYRRIAPIYDVWGRLTESKAQRICAGWIGQETDPLVVDVATGTARREDDQGGLTTGHAPPPWPGRSRVKARTMPIVKAKASTDEPP